MSKVQRIPDVSDAALLRCFATIKPLVRSHCDGSLRAIWLGHPPENAEQVAAAIETMRKQSYPWSEQDRFGNSIERGTYRELTVITTFHTWGYYGFFKPSFAEVIAQIPGGILPRVRAFYVHGPKDADDLNRHGDILEEGYHVAETTLFEEAKR